MPRIDCPHCNSYHMNEENIKLCRIRKEIKKMMTDKLKSIPGPKTGGTKEEWVEGMSNFRTILWVMYIRDAILDRDQCTCQHCGITEKELEIGVGHLEVHHITPQAQGGSDHPANLITLCYKCHTKTFREARNKAMFDDKQSKLEV